MSMARFRCQPGREIPERQSRGEAIAPYEQNAQPADVGAKTRSAAAKHLKVIQLDDKPLTFMALNLYAPDTQ